MTATSRSGAPDASASASAARSASDQGRWEPERQQQYQEEHQRCAGLGENQKIGGRCPAGEPGQDRTRDDEKNTLEILAVVELAEPREDPRQDEAEGLPSPRRRISDRRHH